MKKIILSAVALAVATFTLQAQDGPGKGRHGKGKQHTEVFRQLNLTEDQKTQMKAINEDFRTQMQDLKKNENITVKEQKDKLQSIRNNHKTKMQNLLTADQKAQLEKMKQNREATHKVDAKARMEKMKIRLGLTDNQVAQMEKGRTETMTKVKAIRENKSLSDDQKKDQVKELMKQRKESLKTILTDEQMKKLQEKGHRKAAK